MKPRAEHRRRSTDAECEGADDDREVARAATQLTQRVLEVLNQTIDPGDQFLIPGGLLPGHRV